MNDIKYMIEELDEDYDLLTDDREPTVDEIKVANDILKVIMLLSKLDDQIKEQQKRIDVLESLRKIEQEG